LRTKPRLGSAAKGLDTVLNRGQGGENSLVLDTPLASVGVTNRIAAASAPHYTPGRSWPGRCSAGSGAPERPPASRVSPTSARQATVSGVSRHTLRRLHAERHLHTPPPRPRLGVFCGGGVERGRCVPTRRNRGCSVSFATPTYPTLPTATNCPPVLWRMLSESKGVTLGDAAVEIFGDVPDHHRSPHQTPKNAARGSCWTCAARGDRVPQAGARARNAGDRVCHGGLTKV